MRVRNCMIQWFGCYLNKRFVTDLEIADLDLTIRTGPEVHLDLGPDRRRIIKGEGDLRIRENRRIYCKIIGAEITNREILNSYIRKRSTKCYCRCVGKTRLEVVLKVLRG